MKKVLIFYASYGGGHYSAASSIKQYIDENYDDLQTEIIDCVKYVNNALDRVTTSAYREMAKKAPWAWEKVYYNSQKGFIGKFSTTANKIMAVKIAKLFREFKPDVVISTHPFSSQMTSYLKQKNKTNCKLITILTDFAEHDQWLIGHNFVDLYFISNEKMKESMVKNYEIPESKIFVTGIPISNRFLKQYNKEEICSNFNISPTKKTVLFFGGGEYGLGKDKTVAILNALSNFEDIQIIAISGRNEKMKEAFEKLVKEKNKENDIIVLPFTTMVPELMSVSDLVITKPGGLTTSESLASHLPLIIINPIPGQEEENALFLENSGAGIWLKKDDNIEDLLSSVILNDEKLNHMKQQTINLAKPNSTEDICKKIFEN